LHSCLLWGYKSFSCKFFHVQCIHSRSIITQEATCPVSVSTSTLGHGQHKSNLTFLTFTDIHLQMYQLYVHTSLGTPIHTAILLTTHFHCTFPPVNADQHTMQRCKVPRLPYSLCSVWHSHDISVPKRQLYCMKHVKQCTT
jgi:hypothetical protein